MNQLETLTYENINGGKLVFGVASVYHVNVSQDVTGLSDIDDTIYSTSSNGQDGDTFVGVRIEPKDIKIKGRIRDANIEHQRQYRRSADKILNPKINDGKVIPGTLYYSCGSYTRKIGAIADSAPKWTRDGAFQHFEINLRCLSPFWEEDTGLKADVASWIGDWEFPTEIVKDDETSMTFGHHEESVIVDVFNGGDVSTGMRVVIRALGAMADPLLFNVDTREFLKVNYSFVAGDVLTIDTNYGHKTATLEREGVTTNLFRYIDTDSTFMQLTVGDNLFRYDASSGADNMECSVHYSQKYIGV